ncbi:DNA-dependent helicase II [Candidatus Thiodiazotropha endolucinida]|uniref:DNA 3'-5' helicase II n=2 Tax=Candidatus Thiodiazotropha endolucinida TaxID=1655433 RepID=A0A7Z0VM43_9GAMM|nr:DNA-dependent helicase II [Candidatus Thiodiazotropha endolucinida]
MTEAVTQGDELRETMSACLDLEKPRSFFLYAGAGTGKTRAVVEAMNIFRSRYGTQFRQSGQKVAVITYTNAACDEIRRRIDFDPIFAVSTIHSFAWEQICTYHKDISAWLRVRLAADIAELEERQTKGRAGTKAAVERKVQIESKHNRLQHLDAIKQFTYNPNGENIGKNSLNHAEVIALSAAFLADKPLMRQVLIRKHPVLLIDESQDTQKDLIDAVFALQAKHPDKFCLALFGDTMQRIYADGKVDLEQAVPADWEKPALVVNHRCPKRIVTLLNQIRSEADGAQQEPREDAQEGVLRLFLVNDVDDVDKLKAEAEAAQVMAETASDDDWMNQETIKVLTLEHHMAARRGGFAGFFEPLYRIDRFRTGLLDGTLSGVAFFARQVLPLVEALRSEDRFGVAQVVKEYSPLVSADRLSANEASLEEIRKAGESVESIFSLWDDGTDPVLLDVLKTIAHEGLFGIPDVFAPILSDTDAEEEEAEPVPEDAEDDGNPAIDAWREALSVPFSQLRAYVEYISDRSPFGTHQGIKGLQFPRVMVILDDNEARGFMFSYDKLLGAKALTATDEKNQLEGKDTSVDRTRRLFYVTCSRAEKSLAVVAYTKEADKMAKHMSDLDWFENDEIVRL